VFILGLDGLEYFFVEEFDCKNLKQLNYSQIDVPVNSKKGVPLTPQVWASFLLGEWMDDFEFSNYSRFKESAVKILKFLRRFIPISLGLGHKINVTKGVTDFPELKGETFLDRTDSATINAPFYDFENIIWELSMQFGNDELSLRQLIELCYEHYFDMKDKILSEVSELNNEIVFAYMLFPDYIQHLEHLHPERIKKHYLDLDRFVGELKKRIDGGLMIVSDHGFDFKTQNHSFKGFYSTDTELDFKPEKITDFYPFFVY
jgi:hypothetical protein